nr:retrovirus-related Pol polyprotein from transposon TNT 1-94 [Tanacetum cinerariifolium]
MTAEDMQKRKNDVKAIATLLLDLLDEHNGKSKVPTVQRASTASAQVPTISTDVAAASLSYDTICAFKATQPNGSQIKYKDISEIDNDDIEEMDIKWNLALLSMRADMFWKKTGKKIPFKDLISPRSQDRGKRESYKKDPKVEELAPKEMIAVDADEKEVPTKYALMAKSSLTSGNEMGLPEFVDDTVTDYTRPTPSIDVSKSLSKEQEERFKSYLPFFFEQGGSSGNVVTKHMIKFVKESDYPNATKVHNTENARKPTVKYAEMYINTSRNPRTKIPTIGSKVPTAKPVVVADKGNKKKAIKASARWIWKPKQNSNGQGLNFNGVSVTFKKYQYIDTQGRLKSDNIDDKGYWNSGCSRYMTGNISYLSEYEPFNKGYVLFGHGRGKITDESMLWHRRLGHLNFKTMNKLVMSNMVKGLPSKSFENDHSCVACLKEKHHKASCKFDAKGDEGYFVGYSLTSKAFRVFNKRTKKIEENLHVDFLLNKSIKMELFHEAQMATLNEAAKTDDAIPDNNSPQKEQQEVNGDKEVPESSQNSNPTASIKVSTNDLFEPALSSTVETEGRIKLSRATIFWNAMSFENRLEDFFGDTPNAVSLNEVEADISNMETIIQVSPTPTLRIHKDHPKSQIIGPVDTLVQTRQKTKDVLKNKKYERGIVIRNKARLVTQGHTQEEGIDYDEVFAPVPRIETIRIFLAYASYIGFTLYQMDVKSAFLYETIDDEVYVMQPPGFPDPEFPNRVYKVEEAMYGLHQALRAWYGTLSKYLLDNGFQRGTIDQTLFVRKHKGEFLLVQVYVNDIIFGSSNPNLCREFKALMHDKFQMSAMGELNFFLGLQVLQNKDGIFLSQDKYVGDILKIFRYTDIRAAKTPIDRENP